LDKRDLVYIIHNCSARTLESILQRFDVGACDEDDFDEVHEISLRHLITVMYTHEMHLTTFLVEFEKMWKEAYQVLDISGVISEVDSVPNHIKSMLVWLYWRDRPEWNKYMPKFSMSTLDPQLVIQRWVTGFSEKIRFPNANPAALMSIVNCIKEGLLCISIK